MAGAGAQAGWHLPNAASSKSATGCVGGRLSPGRPGAARGGGRRQRPAGWRAEGRRERCGAGPWRPRRCSSEWRSPSPSWRTSFLIQCFKDVHHSEHGSVHLYPNVINDNRLELLLCFASCRGVSGTLCSTVLLCNQFGSCP